MKLNTGMKDMSDENKYILEYLPVVKQKTYTLGAVYKHFAGHNMYSLIASSSYMNNKNVKYKDNIEEPERLSLDYNSGESEFKLRSENLFRLPYIQLAVGGNVEYIKYTNESYQKIFTDRPFIQEYNTSLGLTKWGLFATATYESYNEDAGNRKVKMFNKEELPLFEKVGLHPVFFGQLLAGQYMPALTYMLWFNDMEQRNDNWTKFVNSDEWNTMKVKPEYANTVSKVRKKFLIPLDYSQI